MLPAQQATAFSLRYLEGLELDAIADAMNIGRGTVRIHLYRALQKLKAADALKETPMSSRTSPRPSWTSTCPGLRGSRRTWSSAPRAAARRPPHVRRVAPSARSPGPGRIAREAILGEVRRRQHRRRMVASAGATAAVVALVLLVSPQLGDAGAVETSRWWGVPPRATCPGSRPRGRGREGRGVRSSPSGRCFDEVHGYTRTNPSVADETYRPFGALAAWVRPPDVTALDSEPFQSALAVLQVSQSK